jgi:hypothetical protein
VVKQLPVEMFQQWSSANSCTHMRTCTIMEKHYTVCQHSNLFSEWPYGLFLVFRNTLLILLWPLIVWIPTSVLLSCPRKQLTSAFWQTKLV